MPRKHFYIFIFLVFFIYCKGKKTPITDGSSTSSPSSEKKASPSSPPAGIAKIPPKPAMSQEQIIESSKQATTRGELSAYHLWGPFPTVLDFCTAIENQRIRKIPEERINAIKTCEAPPIRRALRRSACLAPRS